MVTVVTIGVGVCLLFGLFTRLASIVGALFLFGVIASQPFWISATAPTINQCVEFTALLVLAGTGAGRWAGIDGCLAALFRRRRALVVEEVIRSSPQRTQRTRSGSETVTLIVTNRLFEMLQY